MKSSSLFVGIFVLVTLFLVLLLLGFLVFLLFALAASAVVLLAVASRVEMVIVNFPGLLEAERASSGRAKQDS